MNLRTLTPVLLFGMSAAACGGDDGAAPTTPSSVVAPTLEAASASTGSDRLPVIVDYSPTSSDVAALMYVTQHPDADLLAVTLAGTGESHCDQGVANTRALLAAVGLADVPVACGQDQPVGAGNEWPADWRAAADRLEGLDLRATAGADDGEDAADLLASIIAERAPVTIIALGPLTNLAIAIERHPELTRHVADVVTMGGAVDVGGNATDGIAEWNYFIDPTAVDVVLRSGMPVTMVPLDATNTVPVTEEWVDALAGHRTTVAANVVHDLFAASRPYEFGFYFWDELAAAAAFDDRVATFEEGPIVVELAGPEQGRTRIDPTGVPVKIAVDADRYRFERDLLVTLNGGTEPPELPAATEEEIEYFRAVEATALALGVAVEDLFQTPLAFEVEEIANRVQAESTETVGLTPAEEAALREFFTTFWAAASDHIAALGDELRAIDPPDSIRAPHDAYVIAVDDVVDDTRNRIADIRTRDAADLLTILWEPDAAVEAMNAACELLGAEARDRGIDAETCPQ